LVDGSWDWLCIGHREAEDAAGAVPKGKQVNGAGRFNNQQSNQAGQQPGKGPKHGALKINLSGPLDF
jgi:hypothetical protein